MIPLQSEFGTLESAPASLEMPCAEDRRPLVLPPLPADWTLSIVMPTFNVRDHLVEMLRQMRSVPRVKEIILIDEASTDGTRDLLRFLEGDADLRILFHPRKKRTTSALRSGLLRATGDVVLAHDARLDFAEYQRLLMPILQNNADIVFGSRFLDKNGRLVRPFWPALGNRVLTTMTGLLTNVAQTDPAPLGRAFRREIIDAIAPQLKQTHFDIGAELTACLARGKYRLFEVGIPCDPRTVNGGGWSDGLRTLLRIPRYWRVDR